MAGFKEIDDYDWIVGKSFQSESEQFTALIRSFMPPDKAQNLIFCLFEKVTITNKSKIGDIHLLSHDSQDKKKKIIEKYKQIIKSVIDEKKFNPSEHIEWYKSRKTYFSEGENVSADVHGFDGECYEWYSDFPENASKDESFSLKEGEISKEEIIQYLDLYAQKLEDELLKKYPFYTVLIKPICVKNPQTGMIYPLGNIYLHFGFLEKIEKDKLEKLLYRLINRLWVIWFRAQGHVLIEEIQTIVKNDVEQKSQNKFQPKLPKDPRIKEGSRGGILLNQFITQFESDLEKQQKLKDASLLIIQKLKDENIDFREDIRENKIPTFKRTTPPEKWNECNYNKILGFYIRRRIVIAFYIVLSINIKRIHSLFVTGVDDVNYRTSAQSLYAYFWNNLYLSLGNSEDENFNTPKIREKVCDQLSEDEKQFYKECLEYLKTLEN